MDAESSSVSNPSRDPHSGTPHESGPHVTIGRLREYRAHRLGAAEEARIQGHLSVCDDCRELAVDASAFFDPLEPGEVEAEIDKGASWKRLEGALGRQGWFEERRLSRKLWASSALRLAAALVALTVVGLTQFLFGFGTPGKVLVPVGAYKGAGEEIVAVRLPVRLKLSLAVVVEAPSYRVDLFDGYGSRIRLYEGLHADRDGRLPLRLRRWQLAPGRYHLEVRAVPESPGGVFDEFDFEVLPR